MRTDAKRYPNDTPKNPGDFRSWESPQTLSALFIGLSMYNGFEI